MLRDDHRVTYNEKVIGNISSALGIGKGDRKSICMLQQNFIVKKTG